MHSTGVLDLSISLTGVKEKHGAHMSYMSLTRAAVFSSSFVSLDSSRLEPPPRAHTTAVDIPCCPPACRRAAAAAPHAIHAPPTPPVLCPPALHARSLRPRRPPLRPRAARAPPPPSASAPPPLLLCTTTMLRTAAPAPCTAHAAAPHTAAAAAQCSQGVRHIARATFCTAFAPRSRSCTLAS